MSVQLHVKRHPAAADDQTLIVALRQLALTEDQVRGLLSIGRAERQPAEVFELRHVLADVAFLVGPACQHAKVNFTQPAEDGPESIEVLADRSGIRAAILNLALNAIEAAGQGGSVAVEIHCQEDEVTVEVADSGPGPPPELAETLCDAFVTSKPEGVGLGLALARRWRPTTAAGSPGVARAVKPGSAWHFPGVADSRRGLYGPHLDRG